MTALTEINDAINLLATAGGATLLQQGEAKLIAGRRAIPITTAVVLTDVVSHPVAGGDVNTVVDGAVRPIERLAVYLRTEALPAVGDPNGTDPAWFLVSGKYYKVESVEAWAPGLFWVAQCVRVRDDRAVGKLGFGVVADLVFDIGTINDVAQAALNANVAFAPVTAVVRLVFDPTFSGVDERVVIVWATSLVSPAGADGSSSSAVFRAIDSTGASVVVEPLQPIELATASVDGGTYFVVILPRVVGPDGLSHYELS